MFRSPTRTPTVSSPAGPSRAVFSRAVFSRAALSRVALAFASLGLLAVVVVAMVWMPRLAPALGPWLYLAAVAPWLVLIDVRERRLPNRLVLPGFAAWTLGAAWVVLADPNAGPARVLAALAAGGAYALVLGALAWWGGMGGGDLKLGVVLGLALGLVSPAAAVIALPLAFVAGAVVAVVVLVASPKGERRGRSIPFGPCLLFGAVLALMGGVLLT